MIFLSNKLNKKKECLEYIKSALSINSENVNYFIQYLNNADSNNNSTSYKDNTEILNFDDIIKLSNEDKVRAANLLKIINEDLKPKYKSRILNKFELALSNDDNFKKIFSETFLHYIKLNIPSIFINVKFIYTQQSHKIQFIEEIILKHLNSIKENKSLDLNLLEDKSKSSNLNVPTSFIWVYYFAALHYDFKKDLETALKYINMAIDSTPTVPEFFMVKSKILNHGNMLTDAAIAYNVAKRLDLGDRYLNAKLAKIQLRNNELEKGVSTLREFVKDPLSDDNLEHLQCMWFEIECGYAYLKKKTVLQGYRLFKAILLHFNTLIEDQVIIFI